MNTEQIFNQHKAILKFMYDTQPYLRWLAVYLEEDGRPIIYTEN